MARPGTVRDSREAHALALPDADAAGCLAGSVVD